MSASRSSESVPRKPSCDDCFTELEVYSVERAGLRAGEKVREVRGTSSLSAPLLAAEVLLAHHTSAALPFRSDALDGGSSRNLRISSDADDILHKYFNFVGGKLTC